MELLHYSDNVYFDGSVNAVDALYNERIHKDTLRKVENRRLLLNNLLCNLYLGGTLWTKVPKTPKNIKKWDMFASHKNSVLNYTQLREIVTSMPDLIEVKDGWCDHATGCYELGAMRAKTCLFDLLDNPRMLPMFDPVMVIRKKRVKKRKGCDEYIYLPLKKSDTSTMISELEHRNNINRTSNVVWHYGLQSRPLTTDMRRVFNDSLEYGGRFYDSKGIQSIPRELVCLITIDREPITECDYSAIHPTLLYADVGLSLDFDPYTIDFECELDVAERGYLRNFLKVCLNVMINGEDRTSTIAAINVKLGLFKSKDKSKTTVLFEESIRALFNHLNKKYKVTVSFFIEALTKRNKPIEKHLNTGAGRWLMRKDSDLAMKVMQSMGEECCLCKHDSFIVQRRHVHKLKSNMEGLFLEMFGQPIKVKVK